MPVPLRILIVEDSEDDAALLIEELRAGGLASLTLRVQSEAEMRAALGGRAWDLVIADYHVPGFEAPEALAVLRQAGADVPFIVVSGHVGEEAAAAVMKAGAHDFLIKGRFARLVPAIRRELAEAQTRRERRHLEREVLRVSEEEEWRISRELHDGLGQTLTGIAFMAHAVAADLAAAGSPSAPEAATIAHLASQATDLARSLARGLSPHGVRARDLAAALQDLAARTAQTHHLACTFDAAGPIAAPDDAAATGLYRIAQDAVAGALRDGAPRHVRIALAERDGWLSLSVENDAALPAPGLPDGEGIGIRVMRYRASALGALIEVRPSAHGGSLVTCSLPRAPLGAPGRASGRA